MWIKTRPTCRDVTTGFPTKCRLQNERRNSIPMTCHYPHLGSASDWFKQISSTHDQSETVIPRTLFRRETSGGVAKCRLFSPAKNLQPFDQIEGNSRVFCFLASPTITPAKEKKRRNRVKRREEREDKKNERFVFLHFTLATLKEKKWRMIAHFCIEVIWNFWKTSSYTPDSIVSYEAFFGVVTQHFSVSWRHKNAPGVPLGILVGICRDIPKWAKTVTVFRPKRRKNPLGRHITINAPHKGVIVPGKSGMTTVFLNPNRTILIEFNSYLKCMAPAAHGPGFHTNSSQSLTDVTRGAWGKHIWFSDPAHFSCHIIRQNTLKKENNKTRLW